MTAVRAVPKAGVHDNVTNASEGECAFVEIELEE